MTAQATDRIHAFRGEAIVPGDDVYDDARALWNGAVDRHPRLIARCKGTADAEAFVTWHAGQLPWAEATRDSRIELHGPSWLVRAFPTWNGRSSFAHIRPAAVSAI